MILEISADEKAWALTADLPVSLRYHTSVVVDKKILVFGGFYFRVLNWVIIFDGRNWKKGGNLLRPRMEHSTISLGNMIVHVGAYGQ